MNVRYALMECPSLNGNIQKETEKCICYDFMRFGDSSTVPNLLKQYIAFIRAYLDTISKNLRKGIF